MVLQVPSRDATERSGTAPCRTVPGGSPDVRSLVVDARGFNSSGIGRYLREVLRVVLADRRFGPVTLVGDPAELAPLLHAGPRAPAVVPFVHRFYAPRGYAAWLGLRARGLLDADVAFFPHYDVPPGNPSRLVVTVHDLAHFRLREQFPAWRRTAAAFVLRRALRRAARVLTVSEFSRRDLAAWHPASAHKVEAVPNGVLRPRTPSTAALDWANVHGRFILSVGNRKPHKNLVAAVETLALLRPRFPSLRLVIAGRAFGAEDGVARRARELGVADAVAEVGEVDDDRLHALYAAAACLLFPSTFEGFGLPVLEAMAAGLPVVASDRGPIPEVAGDAALLVPPHAYGDMADAVARVLSEPRTRSDLAARGRARAAAFSWTRTGERVADILYRTASGG